MTTTKSNICSHTPRGGTPKTPPSRTSSALANFNFIKPLDLSDLFCYTTQKKEEYYVNNNRK